MDIEKLANRLAYYNEWRRGIDGKQPHPVELGADIDEAVSALREIARLRAEVEALRVDAEICSDLVQIVEGHFGAVHHGVWTDRAGLRLKDTKRWARFYVMTKKLDAAIDAARGQK